MKVWMPYLEAGSGADISSLYLAAGLKHQGIKVVLQPFNHYYEFMPRLLFNIPSPPNTDIVLTNSWNGFAFNRLGVPMITVDRLFVLDPTLDKYKNFFQRIYHKRLIKRYILASIKASKTVVAVSDYTARILFKVLNLKKKPKVILNAVDTDFFSPNFNDNLKNSEKKSIRLLFVGNLTKRKGADMLVPIMRQLGSGFQLYYTTGLRDHNLPKVQGKSMYALGRLTQEQVREQYRKADLLLFPSRGEGLPRAVMESLACGTPVVAADVSSMPEAVTPEVGRLCPADNVEEFVKAILGLAKDRNCLKTMRFNARAKAEKLFDQKRMVKEYIQLFEKLYFERSHFPIRYLHPDHLPQ